jgi:hypothetical protein
MNDEIIKTIADFDKYGNEENKHGVQIRMIENVR